MTNAVRLAQGAQRIGIRGFHTSRVRMSGVHYPEGPLGNIPWTPKGKWNIRFKMFGFFGICRYSIWLTLGFGFALPFVAAWWQLYGPCLH